MPARFWLPLILLTGFGGAEVFTIGYLTNIHGRENPSRQGLVISGAISYALDVVNSNTSLLGGHQLRMIYNDTEGDTLIGTNVTIQQWRRGAIAFFGPEDSCEVEATVAASLNLPMISYKCADSRVSDKGFYKTFARTNPSDKGVVRSILVLLRYYRWRKFTIISEASNPYMTVAKSLEQQAGERFMVNRGRGVAYFANVHVCCEDGMPCCEDPFARVVEDTYKYTRVYVFFGSRMDLIHFSTMLQMRKLLDSGEYVLLYIDFEAYSEHEAYIYFWRMDMRPHHVAMAMRAARSLLVIVPSPPMDQSYQDFEDKVRDYNMQEPFRFPNALPYPKHITESAAYLYDAVMLYAEALSATLAEGEDPRNGTAIVQRIISREIYQSVTGAWLHMDENGDVEGNYTVLSLQSAPHNLVLKGFRGNRNLSHLMLPMATFQYDQGTHEPIFTLLDVDTGWVAPLDEPPCGFDGSGCLDPPGLVREIVSGLLLLTLLILSVICWIMYKKWKYEQEIAGLLWRIPLKDIQRCGSDGGRLSPSSSKMSVASQESRIQTFTQTALFKGTLVATKTLKFKSKNVEIQREIKKEMKTLRELHYDNINPFIGACVQPHFILLVTEYCAKGSLKDILENSDIKLDHVFIASLVFDLIKGMIFLHDSDLRIHGNLKSSNCVVTSRWVLRITDFGLRELYAAAAEDDIFMDYKHYSKLLWRAPELLRDPSLYPRGTQKGDVYSFAIVLHEIVLRKGPFGSPHGHPPEDIVFRVREGPLMGGEPLRPHLGEALQDYVLLTMSECWSEAPDARPDFRHIKEKLKKMKDGITSSNIVDNMMAMMERYADNLEQLVEERTAQLAEEQSKTEALLHRMLPRSAAEQLMRGEAVVPESFETVTIYFSDIVGFTEMSAASTPMEVVTFLNDLYTVFDSIIDHYDVYKVETIGDAYMVVSGLPLRNGQQHAAEVASMALDLLEAVSCFRIRHRPRHNLQLRVGIHSGPVVSGVVGLTMPRYCLFGDTVNTASRMESSGEALKIHISEQCNEILRCLGGYRTESRGLIKMKGKGEMRTHWLLGYDCVAYDQRRHLPQWHPPPLFSDSEGWRTEFSRRSTSYTKHLTDPWARFLRLNQSKSRKDWNAGYEGSVPESLENPDEGFDGRSRKSSNNSKPTREVDTASLADEASRPLICGTEDLASLRRHHESWKRSWSVDAIDFTLKDWFTNVFGTQKDTRMLYAVGEKAEESAV